MHHLSAARGLAARRDAAAVEHLGKEVEGASLRAREARRRAHRVALAQETVRQHRAHAALHLLDAVEEPVVLQIEIPAGDEQDARVGGCNEIFQKRTVLTAHLLRRAGQEEDRHGARTLEQPAVARPFPLRSNGKKQ